jgi:putative N6-adenine-specific DNA methylase
MAPGLFRKEFAFEKWPDYDAELYGRIYNDDSKERPFSHHIYGYDIDMKAVNTARLNVKAAGLADVISVAQKDFKDFEQPAQKSIIVTNPPYGERITTPNILETYRMIGERLKHALTGCEAWILSYREECFQQIGLRPSLKIPLYNGSLECELRKYVIFDGRLSTFRGDGGIVKTQEELEQMAEKHRFKRNREFNESRQQNAYQQRLDEQQQNEDGDIRSFTFHQHQVGRFGRGDDRRQQRRGGDDRRQFRRGDDGQWTRQHDDDEQRPRHRGDSERRQQRRDERDFRRGEQRHPGDNRTGGRKDFKNRRRGS